MSKFDNAMRRQALSLPALLEEQYHDLEPKARSILSFQEIFSIQRIILTGGTPGWKTWLRLGEPPGRHPWR